MAKKWRWWWAKWEKQLKEFKFFQKIQVLKNKINTKDYILQEMSIIRINYCYSSFLSSKTVLYHLSITL